MIRIYFKGVGGGSGGQAVPSLTGSGMLRGPQSTLGAGYGGGIAAVRVGNVRLCVLVRRETRHRQSQRGHRGWEGTYTCL